MDGSFSVKLIFRGKLLADDKTLESYDVKEDSVIMLMSHKQTAEQNQLDKDYEDHRAVSRDKPRLLTNSK